MKNKSLVVTIVIALLLSFQLMVPNTSAHTGGTFTITNGGTFGSMFSTPIINPPEVAILGISKTYEKVVSSTNGFENRSFLPISLSYDHRAINGVYAVQFTSQLGEALSDDKLIEKSFK